MSELPSMTGSYEHSIDPKDRLVLPKEFRPHFEPGIVIHPREEIVTCYTMQAWATAENKIRRMVNQQEIDPAAKRLIFTSVTRTTVDSQGRVKLPPAAIKILGIDGKQTDREIFVGGADDQLVLEPLGVTWSDADKVGAAEALRKAGL